MTQEDKQLLIKDLCARLPYGVICKETLSPGTEEEETWTNIQLVGAAIELFMVSEEIDIKPYLRPMSSMTKEEKRDFEMRFRFSSIESIYISGYGYVYNISIIDWFNEHHLDYRGLIPMGLALEAPDEMYKTE